MSRTGASNTSTLERKTLQLSALEARRVEKRRLAEELFERSQAIRNQLAQTQNELKQTENELMNLDEEIDGLEREILDESINEPGYHAQGQANAKSEPTDLQRQANVKPEPGDDTHNNDSILSEDRGASFTQTQADELLTDPMTMTMNPDEQLSDPVSQTQGDELPPLITGRPPARSGSVGPLELTSSRPTGRKESASKQVAFAQTLVSGRNRENNAVQPALPATKGGTIESYFSSKAPKSAPVAAAASAPHRDSLQAMFSQQEQSTAEAYDPNEHYKADNFPWSQQVVEHLRRTFRIESFRGHQKEIINATLSGDDVFVIMRTGGGKSLTYQLPALIEGRSQQRKVTFVVSPLLSLIQDQEEQMNQFVPNSALSFTSGLQGGNAEHARRWGLVRDPAQGVCLVFITPEKVHKSGKLRSEMQKLFDQGRLGRFVIDEAHCCCQWGHDFRPDYAQLGILKRHFPSIPIIAVTATASDIVRDDVCKILKLGTNYRFFRSTANRPNLHYSVRPKPDGKDAVVADMAEFIKEKHPRDAGIVYTFSRKDADTVASTLCDYGVVARSYHSDVTAKNKEYIHQSWMRNETQVVVATIAFGLGINKPDVRFVLHHTISKTLEAYYQESGRAGRDGENANCVLYYSPKDVPRMIKMVHGSSSERILWPMVRYAQASGNDSVCKAIILKNLGEPNCPDVMEVQRANDGITTDPRDVGKHAKTVTQLLCERSQDGDLLTMPMLVKEWRAKPDNAAPCVKANPPAADGLSVSDCERIVIALLVEDVFDTNIVWNAYDGAVYLRLGRKGHAILTSPDPKFVIRLPKRDEKKPAAKPTKAAKQVKARKTIAKDGEWLSAKPKAVAKRKKAPTSKGKATKKAKTKPKAQKKAKKRAKSVTRKSEKPTDVIELSSDEDEEGGEDGAAEVGAAPPLKRRRSTEETLWKDESSEEEWEFDE